jgi:hypothetical protein
MGKADPRRVEEKAADGPAAAVKRISDDRNAEPGEMATELVRAPGERLEQEQRPLR